MQNVLKSAQDGFKTVGDGVKELGDKLKSIKDSLFGNGAAGKTPNDGSGVGDNPQGTGDLNSDGNGNGNGDPHLPGDKKMPPARQRSHEAFDRFIKSVDQALNASGFIDYVRGFFPSSSSGSGCPGPFVVEVPIKGSVVIDVCPFVRIFGDAIMLFAIAAAFRIART